jgi:hypothetical protein
MGGGGIIIINQGEVIKAALQNPAFASNPDPTWQAKATALIEKPICEWTQADCFSGLVLLGQCIPG